MKKKKVSKKIIVLICSILLAIIAGVSTFLYMKNKELVQDINKHYAVDVVTIKNAKIYNSKKEEIGSVNKDCKFELDKIKVTSSKNKYLKIKDSNYYLYYKDISKSKDKVTKQISDSLLIYNLNLVTEKKIDLYQAGKKVITLNDKLNIPIQYMDNEYYYINYFGSMYQVKKNSGEKTVEKENTKEKAADYVLVFHYTKVQENCNETLCATINQFKEQLNYLKENNYYTLSLSDYELYLDNKVRLKDKAVLITTLDYNDNVKNISNEYKFNVVAINNSNIKFNDSNNKSVKENTRNSADRYIIKNITTLDNFKKMVNGENIVEKVYVAPVAKEQSIAVLNYHFFNDPGDPYCQETICLDVNKFREHLEYLKNNGYKTLKMREFKQWMYGEIELPEKSVLITVDDGAKGTGLHNGNKLIPLLEEYNMYATLFLISGWWSADNYRSPNLEIQSHTFDMHQYGDCGRGQVVCASHDALLADLKKSLEIVDNNDSFCFPFYSYSNLALQTVQEAGFKLAFVGGNVKAKRSNNKFLIPRYVILNDITMNQFINMIS